MPVRIQRARVRIDGISYSDGASACVVIAPGGRVIHRTRRYRRETADGLVPGMRALKAAQRWVQTKEADVLIEIANG